MAKYFSISIDQLLGYAPLPKDYDNGTENQTPSIVIPTYAISAFSSTNDKPTEWFTWVTPTTNNKEKTFALLVDHNELQPIFDKETILIVEPHRLPAQRNDYLAIKFLDTDTLHVKRFLVDGGENYFTPLNPRLKAIHTTSRPHEILGIITEAHIHLRD